MEFKTAIERTKQQLLHNAKEVDTGHWQNHPTQGHPDLVTQEILNVFFLAEIPPTVNELTKQINPSLPWADLEFEERVGREPHNPHHSLPEWPWWVGGPQAESAMSVTEPDVDERLWAQLAAWLEAEGSFGIKVDKRNNSKRPRIQIYQADKALLEGLRTDFKGVGKIVQHTSGFNRPVWRWQISRRGEMEWILPRILPYLRTAKKEVVGEAIALFESKPYHGNEIPLRGVSKFSHSYSERFWPVGYGIRFPHHNLDDLVSLLLRYPYTRQAYLPMFGFEDTGAVHGRVPCSLGWHFMLREDKLHLWYIIRSCDYVRHFRDDLYLSARLLLWVLKELQRESEQARVFLTEGTGFEDHSATLWSEVVPGNFHFHCFSMHYHRGDEHLVQG